MIAFNKTKNRGWITLCFAVPIYSSSHSFFIWMNWPNLGRANSDFPRIEVFKRPSWDSFFLYMDRYPLLTFRWSCKFLFVQIPSAIKERISFSFSVNSDQMIS